LLARQCFWLAPTFEPRPRLMARGAAAKTKAKPKAKAKAKPEPIPADAEQGEGGANEEMVQEVIRLIVQETPSYSAEISAATLLSELQSEADSLDTLEAMMELEEKFHVELEDGEMAKVSTVRQLADLIHRTPRGMKLRTVDDKTYNDMVRRSHAENRWDELDLLEDETS